MSYDERGMRRSTRVRYLAAAVTLGLIVASLASASTEVVDALPARAAAATHPDHAGGGSPLFLELPPVAPDRSAAGQVRQVGGGSAEPAGPAPGSALPLTGIPATVLAAYQRAADRLGTERPSCGVPVPLLAAIGRVESNHARGGNLDRTGRARVPIVGPQLNGGPGVAAIQDTDGGRLDGDRVYDRAVGPMQFIPSTWAGWGADGNGDRAADPQNVFDATLAAARYLCAAGGDLTVTSGLHRAIRAYNRPAFYLRAVLSWMRIYSGGAIAVPDAAAAGRTEEQTPREDRDSGDRDREDAPPGSDGPESTPAGGASREPDDPEAELPAQEPADRDGEAQADPAQEAADLVEPVEDVADEVPDGDSTGIPPLPDTTP